MQSLNETLANIVKGAGILIFGMTIASILGLVEQILFGRILGPEKYGLFNLGITIIMTLYPFTTFGLGSAIIQFIPHNLELNKNDKVMGAIRFSFKFFFFASVIVSIILFFSSNFIAINIFHNSELEIVIKVMSFALIFISLYTWGMNIAQAFKKPIYPALFNNILLKFTEIIVFIFIAVFLGYQLFGALLGYIIGAILASVAYIYVINRKIIPQLKYDKIEPRVKKELFKIGLPLFFTGFTYLFMQYSDRIILGFYMGAVDVGIFTAAFSIASLTLFIVPAFDYIFLPTVAEHYAKKDFLGIVNIFKAVSKWVFIIVFPLVIYLILFPQDIINLIYGNAYISGASSLAILSLGIAMTGLTGVTGDVLIGTRKTKYNLISEICGSISNVALNLLLIPKFGIIGAAIGTSVSISIKNLVSLGFVYKVIQVFPYDRNYIKLTGVILILLPLLSFLLGRIISSQYIFLLIIPIFIILYPILLYKCRILNEYDNEIIKMIIVKLGLYNNLFNSIFNFIKNI